MAHGVSIRLDQEIEIGNKDMKVNVQTDEGLLGTLLISKGNIEWRPANNSVKKQRLTWKKFAALMSDQGKTVKDRKKVTAKQKKKAAKK